jgi:hypothetical protein
MFIRDLNYFQTAFSNLKLETELKEIQKQQEIIQKIVQQEIVQQKIVQNIPKEPKKLVQKQLLNSEILHQKLTEIKQTHSKNGHSKNSLENSHLLSATLKLLSIFEYKSFYKFTPLEFHSFYSLLSDFNHIVENMSLAFIYCELLNINNCTLNTTRYYAILLFLLDMGCMPLFDFIDWWLSGKELGFSSDFFIVLDQGRFVFNYDYSFPPFLDLEFCLEIYNVGLFYRECRLGVLDFNCESSLGFFTNDIRMIRSQIDLV